MWMPFRRRRPSNPPPEVYPSHRVRPYRQPFSPQRPPPFIVMPPVGDEAGMLSPARRAALVMALVLAGDAAARS